MPVHLDVDVSERPSTTVEAVAYFVVSEALTNVAKHSGASRAEVALRHASGKVTLTVLDDGQGFADEAAERIVALGLPIDSRLSTVAAKAKATEVPAGFAPSDVVIRAVIADIDAVLVDIEAAIEGLDEIDMSSQDVAIEIKRGLDKDRWFLFAHLSR